MTSQSSATQADYLRTLPAIRERCSEVYELAKHGKLEYFKYEQQKEGEVVKFCAGIIEVSMIRIEYRKKLTYLERFWE